MSRQQLLFVEHDIQDFCERFGPVAEVTAEWVSPLNCLQIQVWFTDHAGRSRRADFEVRDSTDTEEFKKWYAAEFYQSKLFGMPV